MPRVAHVSAKNGARVRVGVELETALVGEPLAAGTALSIEDEATSSRGVQRLRVALGGGTWGGAGRVRLGCGNVCR